jgi:NADPH2:quinone reductase
VKAIRFHDSGGPEVLRYEDVSDPAPGAGQALIAVQACGLNYIDTYQRSGLYPVDLPCIPGMEAAGTVEAVGEGVEEVAAGDRVAYAGVLGAYAEKSAVDVAKLVKLPDGVDCEAGAALMLQGITAHYLTHSTYPLGNGDTVLVHAAAGGVGLLLTQIAKMLGARVVGTVSTAAKEELARGAGADEVIRYTENDFEQEVLALTEGRGVDVVYDGVAKDTFEKGLNVLKPRGYMVLFGQSSGPVEPFDPAILNVKGSLFLTRPTMTNYIQSREELLERATDLLSWVVDKKLEVRIGDRFPLADAAEAHKALQGRRTSGKVLLLP